jgi:hypothetical protein
MKTDEIKRQLDFYVDALFQKGYDLGWVSVIEQLQYMSDTEWNNGNKVTAEIIRKAIKEIDPGDI